MLFLGVVGPEPAGEAVRDSVHGDDAVASQRSASACPRAERSSWKKNVSVASEGRSSELAILEVQVLLRVLSQQALPLVLSAVSAEAACCRSRPAAHSALRQSMAGVMVLCFNLSPHSQHHTSLHALFRALKHVTHCSCTQTCSIPCLFFLSVVHHILPLPTSFLCDGS